MALSEGNFLMKRIDFIQIPGYALWGLHLSGTELLCYSLIYGFSHSELGHFLGTQEEIADILNISKRTASAAISSLESKGLLEKRIVCVNERKISVLSTKVQNLQYGGQVAEISNQVAKSASTKVQNLQQAPIIYTNSNIYIETDSNTASKQQPKAQPNPPVAATPLPFTSKQFAEAWEELCSLKKWAKKPQTARDKALKKLSRYPEQVALMAIEATIIGDWEGIFPEKYLKAYLQSKQESEQPRVKRIDINQLLH